MHRSILTGLATATVLAAVPAVPAGASAAPWTFDTKTVNARLTNGGEVTFDATTRKVITVDRNYEKLNRINPGFTIVGADRQRYERTVSFFLQPWDNIIVDYETNEKGWAPQVPFGVDSDAKRGIVVTTNTLTDSISIVNENALVSPSNAKVRTSDHPYGVAIDESTGLAYVAATEPGLIEVFDVTTRKKAKTITGLKNPTKISIDEATGTLYVGNYDYVDETDDYVAVVDAKTGTIKTKIKTDPNTRPVFDPSLGKVYAASFNTGKVVVIEPATNAITKTIETGTSPNGLAIDAARHVAYTPNLEANTVTAIDTTTNEVVGTIPVPGAPLGITVDPKTGWTYVSSRDNSLLTAIRPAA